MRDEELRSVSEVKLRVPAGRAWAPELAAQASRPSWQRTGGQHCASRGAISLWAVVLISRGSVRREKKGRELRTELGFRRTYKTAASFTFF